VQSVVQMAEAPLGGRAGVAAAASAAALPDAAWARIAACADPEGRRALRATCPALRRLADAGCVSVTLPGGEPAAAAAGMRALAARAGAFGGLQRLRVRGAGDDCAAPMVDVLRAAAG
jgi:hypothetical protein